MHVRLRDFQLSSVEEDERRMGSRVAFDGLQDQLNPFFRDYLIHQEVER